MTPSAAVRWTVDPGILAQGGGFNVVLVGCGGTGSLVAEGLCRLFADQPSVRLMLIDHDRVEPHNLGRQAFHTQDLGRFKSEALAERLARQHGRAVGYSVYPYTSAMDREIFGQVFGFGLLIGAVDNAAARREMAHARSLATSVWWIDAGNARDSGQVLIGNAGGEVKQVLSMAFDEAQGTARFLPLPSLQVPEILSAPVSAPAPVECAQAVAAGDQSPTINAQMATLVLEAVSRLTAGTLTWMAAYVDLEQGTLRTVPASPRELARITGIPETNLVKTADGKPLPPMCPRCGRRHG